MNVTKLTNECGKLILEQIIDEKTNTKDDIYRIKYKPTASILHIFSGFINEKIINPFWMENFKIESYAILIELCF